MINRILKKEIKIGNLFIGTNHPIAIQSMTNTPTKDVSLTVKQIGDLFKAGCNIVRVACLDIDDAKAIKDIKEQLLKQSIDIPIVADIHFDYRIAIEAINAGCDKVRINPGNIGDIDKIKMVVDKCIEHHIPIRIGVNTGSMDSEILAKYGRSAYGLVMSAKKHVDILESLGFYDIVLSMKASDVNMMIEAYTIASNMFNYPLHLGVTEAGTFLAGSVASSIGIGSLLYNGIGDTIRVSLTDDPVKEVIVAKEILGSLGLINKPKLISCPTCGRTKYDMMPIAKEIEEFLNSLGNVRITVAIMGCAVNGPGEAKDADIGIAGGVNEALLFKKGEVVRKIAQDDIVEELKKEILAMI
ncbi:MAG: flavodoxin-dependent (E)-4-hydroxy-3-methylbut-2-enyl-diphosphate synthase [Bacilli bacterium]|nr:flavodoxin-dependent (E)-4-hydroxy-3-methylbut-2-enyl-diphosphate synthase [Bacilli bacterium]